VRITETEVIIYGPQIDEIARHPLFARHETGQVRAITVIEGTSIEVSEGIGV
jgi:hypothetical protein